MLKEIKFGKSPITGEPLEWMSLAKSYWTAIYVRK